uniref:Uncharacterized protein LOC111101235 n=1 Tax=Crassostrea virginica TaxID=6565 RepID=A0A8B8AH96_CRAVI|nr:uncharacterized protein LOC111101235 [Crassostrea virginica]
MADVWRFTIGLLFLAVTCYACDDMDSSVCRRLAGAKPDMCNDTCFASICQRFCGQCPLKCYNCNDIESSQQCNLTVECSSKDYQCISAASFTNDFREVFKLGCAPSSVCSHYGKRSIDKRAGTSCCNSDLCNHGSGNKRTQELKAVETVKRQVSSPVCDDADSLACTLLFTVNTHMCSDDCIANKICPRLCGKCTKCYECDHVTTTENCTESRVCDPGEVCFTVETLNFNLEHGYKLGCVHQKICDSLHAQASSIFGRRSNGDVELSLTGGCCHGELCNHHQLLPEPITSQLVTTTKPTTTTRHTTTQRTTTTQRNCHYYANGCTFHDAYVYHRECYHIEPTHMTWIQAKHFCESRCGHLASFSDLSVMSHVLSGVTRHQSSLLHTTHTQGELYVDAIDPGHNNQWFWESNLTPVASNFFHSISSHQLSYCAATTAVLQKLVAVDCNTRYYPLCQHKSQDA